MNDLLCFLEYQRAINLQGGNKDYINNDLVNDSGEYTFNTIGTYNIEYVLYDSWGRAVLQELTITVESKVRENEIEVYDSNNSLAFKVTFDTSNNQFVLKGNETSPFIFLTIISKYLS